MPEDGFVLAAVRGDPDDPASGGRWEVYPLPTALLSDLDRLVSALRQQQGGCGATGAIGLVDVDDEFFVAVRITPHGDVRLLLSDVTAAAEFDLARQVHERVVGAGPQPGGAAPDPASVDEVWPAGDLGIFSDLGLAEMELGAILDDLDLYADEMLSDIAGRLGFAEAYEAALDAVSSGR